MRRDLHKPGTMNTASHDNSTSKGDFIQKFTETEFHGSRPQKNLAVMGDMLPITARFDSMQQFYDLWGRGKQRTHIRVVLLVCRSNAVIQTCVYLRGLS